MWCRSPRAAARIGRTSLPAASPATAARADALQSRRACTSFAFPDDPTRRRPSASRSACAPPRTRGATTSTGTSSWTTRADVGPRAQTGRVTSVHPLWAIEGGRITLEGEGFVADGGLPHVRVGSQSARLAAAGATRLTVIVPSGVEGGQTPVRVDELPGESAFVEIGAPLVNGVHHVDSPAYDRHGNLYVTFSGSRGQQAPVSIFVVRPNGTREPFVSDVPNPTSLAFDRSGRLYVSSRFDGSVHRVEPDGRSTVYASDLGIACGLAFGPDGALYVGDRSGSVLRVEADGRARAFASLPASVAAFHLAFGPDGHLYVAAPTLGTHDPVYRISPEGDAVPWSAGYGRPQGLAFDAAGHLYVVEALAGASALYRLRPEAPHAPELMLAGGPLIGVAFD